MQKHLENMCLENKFQPFRLRNDKYIAVQLNVPSPTWRSSDCRFWWQKEERTLMLVPPYQMKVYKTWNPKDEFQVEVAAPCFFYILQPEIPYKALWRGKIWTKDHKMHIKFTPIPRAFQRSASHVSKLKLWKYSRTFGKKNKNPLHGEWIDISWWSFKNLLQHKSKQ